MQNVDKYIDDGITENLQTNDHRYYRGGCWGRYLDIIPQLCRYSNDVVLINGAEGAGKTALADALMQDMQEGFKVALLKGNIKSTLEEVMKEIAKSFSMAWDNNHNDVEVSYDKRPWVLFVDDAHEYAKDIIDNLVELSFSDTEDVKLHLVLFANPNFSLEKNKLSNRTNSKIHTLTLETYSLEETEAFLWYQWHLAGNDTKMPISGEVLNKLYKSSAGNAGKVIEISKKIMSGEEIESPKSQIKVNKYQVIVGALLLLIAYYSFSFILDVSSGRKTKDINIKTKINPVENKNVEAVNRLETGYGASNTSIDNFKRNNIVKKEEPNNNSIASVDKIANVTKPEQVSSNVAKLDLKNKAEDNISKLVKSKIIANEIVDEDKGDAIDAQKSKAETVSVDVKQLRVETILTKEPKLSASSPVIVKDLNPRKESLNNSEQNQKSQEQKVIDLVNKKPQEKQVIKNNKSVSISNKTVYSNQEKDLLNIAKQNYGWQIVASSNEAKIKSFIQEYGLHGAKYYSSKYDSKPWFVLIYGKYSSRDEANAALRKLPSAVAKMKPWLRSYDSIHSSIEQSKRK